MIERITSILVVEIKKLEENALKNPPDKNIPFHYGKLIGQRLGLQKALDAIKQISDEAEAAHEIRR